MADFDGLRPEQARHVSQMLIRVSLSPAFARSSVGLVVDAYVGEAVEEWSEHFLHGTPAPARPYVIWRRVDGSADVELYATDRAWLVA